MRWLLIPYTYYIYISHQNDILAYQPSNSQSHQLPANFPRPPNNKHHQQQTPRLRRTRVKLVYRSRRSRAASPHLIHREKKIKQYEEKQLAQSVRAKTLSSSDILNHLYKYAARKNFEKIDQQQRCRGTRTACIMHAPRSREKTEHARGVTHALYLQLRRHVVARYMHSREALDSKDSERKRDGAR